jgi:hypothetical protein
MNTLRLFTARVFKAHDLAVVIIARQGSLGNPIVQRVELPTAAERRMRSASNQILGNEFIVYLELKIDICPTCFDRFWSPVSGENCGYRYPLRATLFRAPTSFATLLYPEHLFILAWLGDSTAQMVLLHEVIALVDVMVLSC